MILLLGASGYIGGVFARELQRRQTAFPAAFAKGSGLQPVRGAAGIFEKDQARVPRQRRRLHRQTERGRLRNRQGRHAGGERFVAANHRPCLRGLRHSVGACFVRLCLFRCESDVERTDARGKGFDPARSRIPWSSNRRKRFMVSRKPTRRISPFVICRAVFTAVPRRWERKPSPVLAKVTSGGSGFRSMNMTARVITSARFNVMPRCMRM